MDLFQEVKKHLKMKVFVSAYRTDSGNFRAMGDIKNSTHHLYKQKIGKISQQFIPVMVWRKFQWRISSTAWRMFCRKSLSRFPISARRLIAQLLEKSWLGGTDH